MNHKDNNIPKLRFPEFLEEWKVKMLGEITTWTSGGTPSKEVPHYWNGQIPWISASSMRGTQYFDSHTKITEEGLKSGSKLAKKGTLLILVRGSMLFNTIPIGMVMRDLSFNQDVKSISVHEVTTSLFILYWFISNESKVLNMVTGTGIGAGKLDLPDLKSLNISLPSLSEQLKIANFLSIVDEKLQTLKKKKSLLETYKKGVKQKIFSQELRFKDNEDNDFDNWEVKKLGEVCECLDNMRKPLNDNERQKMQGSFPYWGANNIMDYISNYIFDEQIVLLAEDGGNFNEFKTRPIANLYKGKCWVNNHTHVIKGIEGILINEFLYYCLVHKDITGFVSGGTRAKLTKGEMLKIEIPFPAIEEQTKIANFLIAIDEKIGKVEVQIKQMELWKKGLLQQMFV